MAPFVYPITSQVHIIFLLIWELSDPWSHLTLHDCRQVLGYTDWGLWCCIVTFQSVETCRCMLYSLWLWPNTSLRGYFGSLFEGTQSLRVALLPCAWQECEVAGHMVSAVRSRELSTGVPLAFWTFVLLVSQPVEWCHSRLHPQLHCSKYTLMAWGFLTLDPATIMSLLLFKHHLKCSKL